MPFAIRNLAGLAYAGNVTLWRYRSAGDTRANLAAPGYFAAAGHLLRVGDVVLASATDGPMMLAVQAAGPGAATLANLRTGTVSPPASALAATLAGTGRLSASLTLGAAPGIALPNVASGALVAFYDFTDASFETGRGAGALTVLDRSGNGHHIAMSGASYVPTADTTVLGAGRRCLMWDDAGSVFNPLRRDSFTAGSLNFNAVGMTVVGAARWENAGNNVNGGTLARLQRQGETGSLNRAGIISGFSAGIFATATWAGGSNSSNATENFASGNPGTKVLSGRMGKNTPTELRDNDTITNAAGSTTQDVSVTPGWDLSIGGAFRNTASVTPRQYLVGVAIYSNRLADTDLAAVRAAFAAAANTTITV
jgi:hypothetical protein